MTTVTETDLTVALREVHIRIKTRVQPGEFTARMYREANSVTDQAAVTLISDGIKFGLIIFVEKRNINGHPTNIYTLKPPA